MDSLFISIMMGVSKRRRGNFPRPGQSRRSRQAAAARRSRRIPRRGVVTVADLIGTRPGLFTGSELKFSDTETNDDAFAGSWATMQDATMLCVSAVAQGDGESNRDGRMYTIESLHLKGQIKLPVSESAAAPPSPFLARVVVVWDKRTNGVALTPTDVMDAGQTDDLLSFRNLQQTTRFRVLWDKTFVVRPPVMNEGAINLFARGGVTIPFKKSFNFKTPIVVHCSGTTAVVGSIVDNSISVIGIAEKTAATLSFQARTRFRG